MACKQAARKSGPGRHSETQGQGARNRKARERGKVGERKGGWRGNERERDKIKKERESDHQRGGDAGGRPTNFSSHSRIDQAAEGISG